MESSKKNEAKEVDSPFLIESTDKKDDQPDKKVKQKSKFPVCCINGCGVLLFLAVVFVVWFFAILEQPDTDKKDTTSNPSTESARSTTKTKPPTSSPAKVTTPPRVTTNCDGNFYPESSGALGLNTNNPGLKQDINTHHYRIYGNTGDDIRAGMLKCGPAENGNRFFGFTRYKINWVYVKYPASLGCRVQNATVGIQLDIYYPKWEPTEDAEAGLADKWQAYYDHVVEHENVHVQDALNTAKDILNYLNSLSNVPCDLIDSGVKTHMDQLKITEEEFDAKINPAEEAKWLD